MKKLLLFAIILIFFHTGSAQNVIDINGISQGLFPELVPGIDGGDFQTAKRFREFAVTQLVQNNQKIRLNDVIQLDLFQNRKYRAKVDKLDTDVNGTFSVRARLEGFEFAWCFISTSEGKSLLTIDIPEKEELFITRLNPKNGKYFLLDVDKKKTETLEGSPSLVPPTENNSKAPVSNTGTTPGTVQQNGSVTVNDVNSPDVVSVMIVYTPSAESWALSSEGGINNTISQIMQKSNLALGNSNSLLQFELVYSGLVDYTELNTSDDLYRLTNTADGYMDNVHSLRNTYGADVVVLLENISFTGGIGWLMNSTSGSPTYAFSITRIQQASWTYTTVHEVGHNMGCHHSKLQNFQPGPGIFTYSAGWRWTGTNSGQYCSVMTYESGSYFADGVTHTRVPYFSNPSLSYQGVPTGDAVDGDNARTLRETKGVVAAYRTAPCTPPTQQATLFASSGMTTNSMTVGWTRGNGSNVMVLARQGSAVNSNPVNGTGYTANAQFGSGTQIGTGNYVVYNGTGNTLTVTGLNSGTAYYFAVYEYNSPSNCYLTPALTGNASTLIPVPAIPVATAASNITQTGFQANWNASSGATGYYLDVASSNTFDAGIVLNNYNTGNVTTYSVNGLTTGTAYYYRVRAYNTSGTSNNSGIINVVTLTPSAPSAPVAIAASNITQVSFLAKWNASSGATGYFLDVSSSSAFDGGFILNNANVGNAISYTVTGLAAGTSYYYRVRANNSYGLSSNSNVITAVTLTPPAPSAPVATAASNSTQNGFQAKWNASSGATGYRLDVSTSSKFTGFVTGYNNKDVGNTTAFAVTGLSPLTTYYYRVRAYNTGGTSANSNRITVTTLSSLGIPAASSATYITTTGFSANWGQAAGASGYYLDVATNSTFTTYVKNYKNKNVGNVLTSAVTGLTAARTYYYRVRAYNAAETSANSNSIIVTTSASLKAAEIGWPGQPSDQVASFTCYPNPFSDQMTISYSVTGKGKTTLEILDITGRVVKTLVNEVQETGLYRVTWDAGGNDTYHLNAGIYIAKFSSGDYSGSLKIIYRKQ
jgi:phosphodiesterase/alkaline phosphatase D-like protein